MPRIPPGQPARPRTHRGPGAQPAPEALISTLLQIVSLICLVSFIIPAVSADYLREYEETVSRHEWANYNTGGAVGVNVKGNLEYLNTNKIQDFKGLTDLTVVFELNYIHFHVPKDGSSGQTDFVAKIGEDIIASGTVGYNCNMMPSGLWKNTIYYFEFDNFDPKSYTGFNTLLLEWNGTIVPKPYSDTSLGYQSTLVSYSEGFTNSYIRLSTVTHDGAFVGGKMTQMFSIGSYWHNRLQISGDNNNYQVYLTRYNNPSHLTITDKATNVILHASGGSGDVSQIIHSNLFVANITSPKTIYTVTYPLESTGDPGAAPVTIYVQNSQTGALLANARVAIHAAAGDPPTLVEVVNQTLSAGVGTFVLQKSGPANPYPRYYRVFATAPGYSQIIENHSFVVTGNYDVIVEMRPDAGGPANPDNCFVDVYVRDIYANPLASVTVQLGSQIRHTNAAGYVVFEVAKNATYPCSASKSGYVTIESPLTIGADDRYPVNIVLGATSLPTWTPTPGPGDPTGGATPRTPIEKASAGLDVILDNAENFGYLATMILLVYMTIWIVPKK